MCGRSAGLRASESPPSPATARSRPAPPAGSAKTSTFRRRPAADDRLNVVVGRAGSQGATGEWRALGGSPSTWHPGHQVEQHRSARRPRPPGSSPTAASPPPSIAENLVPKFVPNSAILRRSNGTGAQSAAWIYGKYPANGRLLIPRSKVRALHGPLKGPAYRGFFFGRVVRRSSNVFPICHHGPVGDACELGARRAI